MRRLLWSGLLSAGLLSAGASRLAAQAGPTLRAYVDSSRGELVMTLGPFDLPANVGHDAIRQPPVLVGTFPASGSLHGFRPEVVDADGRPLPTAIIHHVNIIDPDHRELFLPISRRILAVGQETGAQRMPAWLFGLPVNKGDRFVFSAMVHNPTGRAYRGVTVRVVFPFTRPGRVFPLWHVYPFQFDVLFPVGDKAFDLPPGRSSRSWEGSPAIPGRVLGLGGHLHEHGVRLRFEDVTTGKTIYDAPPLRDSAGNVAGMPVGRLYKRFGVRIEPTHRYRLTAFYENPMADTIYQGGMGVVGGIFRPDGSYRWPAADTRDSLYLKDYAHAMRLEGAAAPPPAGSAHSHHH